MRIGWLVRLRALFRREEVEAEFDEELRYHLERETERYLARGMTPDEARRAARRALGDTGRLKDEARETWRWRWLDELVQDVAYGARVLVRAPGFTTVAVLSLGFGIGATSTLFGVVDALDFRPLPYPDAERLVWLGEVLPPDSERCPGCPWYVSPATAAEWEARTGSYEAVAYWSRTSASFREGDVARSVTVGLASAGLLDVLGVRPTLGRGFAADDTVAGAEPVALLSHDTWQRAFDGKPDVLGRRLQFFTDVTATASQAVTVVGVLPEDFRFDGQSHAFWVPFSGHGPLRSPFADVVARLRPGVAPGAATAELDALARSMSADDPDVRSGIAVLPLRERLGWGTGEGRGVLFAATGLVLLIAVMNVTGLSLARAVSRGGELALRSALGAPRLRLVRQLVVEGTLLGSIGGVAGLLVAAWGLGIAGAWFRIEQGATAAVLDHRVLAFIAGTSIVVGILTALLPALLTARADLRASLGGRPGASPAPRPGRSTGVLLTLQVASGLVLLTGAGLLGSEFLRLRYLEIGFDPVGLYEAYLFGGPELGETPEVWRAALEEARDRARAVPGATAVAVQHQSALAPDVVRPGNGAEPGPHDGSPRVQAVDPGFLETMGTRVLRGRDFTPRDRAGAPPVAVLNRAAAARFWPGEEAIGQQVFVGGSAGAGEWLTVVGVAEDVERGGMVERHWATVYRPLAQAPLYHPAATLFVRIPGPPHAALAALHAAVRRALGHPTGGFRSVDEALATRFLSQRLNALALNLFAAFALLLAAMGIYGSVAYTVSRRAREIGIRVALGAEWRSVLSLVARDAAGIVAGGIALGLAGSVALARVLEGFVSATSIHDARPFAAAALLVGIAALLAAYLPARRAATVDPVVALRSE